MGNREKRLQRMRQNPKQVSYEDLAHLLLDHGFSPRSTKSSDSHRVFTREAHIITVPYRRPHILGVYVKGEGSLQRSVGSSRCQHGFQPAWASFWGGSRGTLFSGGLREIEEDERG